MLGAWIVVWFSAGDEPVYPPFLQVRISGVFSIVFVAKIPPLNILDSNRRKFSVFNMRN